MAFSALFATFGLFAGGHSPVHLVQEPRFTFQISLSQSSARTRGELVREMVTGKAGEKLLFSREFETAAGTVRTTLILIPELDEPRQVCRVAIEAETLQENQPRVAFTRTLDIAAGRTALLDLWTDPERQVRLVATLSAEWEIVPRLTELLPGVRPLDITVEVVRGEGPQTEVVERHHLGGVLGSPVTYLIRTEGGKVLAPLSGELKETEAASRLYLEILPESIEANLLVLSVKLRQTGKTPYAGVEKLNLGLSDRLPSGSSLELPLPRQPGQLPLSFRVIPVF